jgi:hypothetical protein
LTQLLLEQVTDEGGHVDGLSGIAARHDLLHRLNLILRLADRPSVVAVA